jgi:dihydroneopterin aldolase
MTNELSSPALAGPGLPAGDRILLRGIAAHGHHGVYAAERERGQRFVADVECVLDLDSAAATDELARTLDYGTLAAAIVADIEGDPLNLIEALADRIAHTCLNSGPVRAVAVTVHKPEAPVAVTVADVAVTLIRSK